MANQNVGNYLPAPQDDPHQAPQGGGIRDRSGQWIVQNSPPPPPPEFYRAQPATMNGGGLGALVPSGAVGLVALGLVAWGAYEWWQSRDEGGSRKNPPRKKKRYLKGKL